MILSRHERSRRNPEARTGVQGASGPAGARARGPYEQAHAADTPNAFRDARAIGATAGTQGLSGGAAGSRDWALLSSVVFPPEPGSTSISATAAEPAAERSAPRSSSAGLRGLRKIGRAHV